MFIWPTSRPSTTAEEARIQTWTLPAVGWSGLFALPCIMLPQDFFDLVEWSMLESDPRQGSAGFSRLPDAIKTEKHPMIKAAFKHNIWLYVTGVNAYAFKVLELLGDIITCEAD